MVEPLTVKKLERLGSSFLKGIDRIANPRDALQHLMLVTVREAGVDESAPNTPGTPATPGTPGSARGGKRGGKSPMASAGRGAGGRFAALVDPLEALFNGFSGGVYVFYEAYPERWAATNAETGSDR